MGADGDNVVGFEGLVDGDERVEAVRAGRADVQAEVDFGVGADKGGHTGSF